MKHLALGLALAASMSVGCASMDAQSVVATAPTLTSNAPNNNNESVSLASHALLCALGGGEATRCQALAEAAGFTREALAQAQPGVMEMLSERVAAQSRVDRLSITRRTTLLRWFDLASGAAREAYVARVGAQATALRETAARANGHPELHDAEVAVRRDVRAARMHAQLDALLDFVPEANELGPEAEATALLILAHRVDSATQAREEVRGDATAAIGEILANLHPETSTAPNSNTLRAHERTNESPLVAANTLIADRIAAISERITHATLRTTAVAVATEHAPARR